MSSLETIHAQTYIQVTSQRSQQHRKRLNKRMTRSINFSIGNYVLAATNIIHHRRKSDCNWTGPAQIIDSIDEYIFVVKDLITSDKKEIHAERLKFYDDSSLNVFSALLDNVCLTSGTYLIDHFLDYRENPDSGVPELLVRWKGFDKPYDTWEPLHNLKEDVPSMVASYISSHSTALPNSFL